MTIHPTQLNQLLKQGLRPQGPVAVDTETSGLHVDSGARISTISISWVDHDSEWRDIIQQNQTWDTGIQTWNIEQIDRDETLPIVSLAWPFDQGLTGKPEDQGDMFDIWTDQNLDQTEWDNLLQWLDNVGRKTGLVMHNSKFDLHMLREGTRHWKGKDLHQWVTWDTQNVTDLLWGKTGTTSLKPTAKRLWGENEGDEQDKVKNYLAAMKLPKGRWDLMPWDIVAAYADQDARLTIRLYERQLNEINKGTWLDGKNGTLNTMNAIGRRLATTKMLYRVEQRGLPFDRTAAAKAAKVIDQRAESLQHKLPFRPINIPAAKHYWFGKGHKYGVEGLNLDPIDRTDLGQPQLNRQVLSKMVEQNYPHAIEWRDIDKLQQANIRWYRAWSERAGTDNRLRTSIRQNGTVSGRFSVENIQLQAIPHDYRLSGYEILNGISTPRQLIGKGTPPGWELWELDLAQAELRVAALYAKCQRMLQLINEGADLHGDAATQLFGVNPGDETWGQMRNVAKRANFSLIFGVGWRKLQNDIDEQTGVRLTDKDAQNLVRDWNNLYPEYKQAINLTMDTVQKRMQKGNGYGWVTLKNGERRWFKPGEDAHKAFNQRVQPNLAQFGIDWWLNVERQLMYHLGDQPIPGVGRVGMVLMVHDSMVLLLPQGQPGRDLVDMAIQTGIDLWDDYFPGVPGGVDAKPWSKPE
jgi:DNA polymerase I-like protein with 3'-5' exonuclease and polymerase domains